MLKWVANRMGSYYLTDVILMQDQYKRGGRYMRWVSQDENNSYGNLSSEVWMDILYD